MGGTASRSLGSGRALLFCGAFAVLGACATPSQIPPETAVPVAGQAGSPARSLSPAWTSAMDAFLDFQVWIGAHSGYVAMFALDGRLVHVKTAGFADIESRRAMDVDTRFRMASMTKPVTAVAALILIEEGRLALDDPVANYIPAAASARVATSVEVAADGRVPTERLRRPLTVRDLLTFRAGIGSEEDPSPLGRLWAERNVYEGGGPLGDRVDRILRLPLYEQPGERWRYGWSADVLGRVVEVAAGEPLARFVRSRILDPLGMRSSEYLSPEIDRSRLATLYTQDEKRRLTPVATEERDAQEWTPGGSGLVSTAPDFMRFALMLWNRGSYDGARILSPASVERMTQAHVCEGVLSDDGIEGLGWGLGIAVVLDSGDTPVIDRDGDFWWSGVYGTTFFVSPSTGLVAIVLAQNEPSEYSRMPIAVFLAPAFAFFGLEAPPHPPILKAPFRSSPCRPRSRCRPSSRRLSSDLPA